jgi:hypothetical protein
MATPSSSPGRAADGWTPGDYALDSPLVAASKQLSTFGGQELTDDIQSKGSASGFGGKRIGFLGSFALLFNNYTGPGVVALISIYITCGWVPATLLFMAVGVMCGQVSVYLVEAMQMVPGNENFEKRVELMYMAKRYLSKPLYWTSMVFFLLNLQLTNIGSIIVSTQQADWTIIACGVPSYALELYPNFSFTHTPFVNNSSAAANSSAAGGNGSSTTADSPFGDAYVISLGYLIVLAAAVPLGYMNLDDNIWVQIICAGILILVVFTAW